MKTFDSIKTFAAIAAFMLLGQPLIACMPPGAGGGAGGRTVKVVNALQLPVCKVNMWKEGAAPSDSNWLERQLGPGETYQYGVNANVGEKWHVVVKSCNDAVLTERDLVLADAQEVLVK